ncbi:MAG: DUF2484 family protein [Pseudomonadota bacterium]
MIWTALLGCIWIVLVSIVALTPFPQHKPYALAMLVLLPALLLAVALKFGGLWAVGLFVCAASIYRYPLMFLLKWLRRRLVGDG